MNRDQLALETYRNSFAGPTRLAAGSVTLFDNTLRDGEQTPGVAFTTAEKVAIGRLLAETGIPALEAGFAAVSAEEREAIRAVVDAQTGMTVFSLCRCVEADVAAACACGVEHVTVYTPVSELQLRRRLQGDFTVVQDRIRRVVAAAKSRGLFVRFSCEEAFRTPPERLVSSYLTAKEVGADMLSLPDTVGVATPWAVERCLALLQREVGLPVSVHFHNDLGLSVANALAAMLAGATEVQVCANGLGERAGNTPLEQVALAALYQLDYDFGVNLEKLTELSTLVSKAAGTEPASNQPIFGANVFTHESGAHLHGLLQSPACYEPFPPPLVGREHRFVLGKHSGRAAVRHVLSGWLPEAVRLGGKHVAAPAVAVQQEALFEQVKLEWVAVDFGGVRVERCRQFGGPWLGLELIRTLGLDEFLKRKLPQGQEQIPWALMALVLVLARLCDPSSELHLAEHGYEELVGAGPIIGCAHAGHRAVVACRAVLLVAHGRGIRLLRRAGATASSCAASGAVALGPDHHRGRPAGRSHSGAVLGVSGRFAAAAAGRGTRADVPRVGVGRVSGRGAIGAAGSLRGGGTGHRRVRTHHARPPGRRPRRLLPVHRRAVHCPRQRAPGAVGRLRRASRRCC